METYFLALAVILAVAVVAWGVSISIRNVSFVDSLWSLFFLIAAIVYTLAASDLGLRGLLVLGLVAIWALRLSIYITARNWGKPEDSRYQKIRKGNEPFWIKSLYIVFILQGLLAWIVSLPLLVAITHPAPIGLIDGSCDSAVEHRNRL